MAAEQSSASTPEREAFYDRISGSNLAPLWERLHGLVTPQPVTPCSRQSGITGTSGRI